MNARRHGVSAAYLRDNRGFALPSPVTIGPMRVRPELDHRISSIAREARGCGHEPTFPRQDCNGFPSLNQGRHSMRLQEELHSRLI